MGQPDWATRRLYAPVAAVLLAITAGTAGYVLIEGWPPLDALYMAVTTVAGQSSTMPYSLPPMN